MLDFDQLFRQRGYRHFDRPVSLKRARQLATDPKRVAVHAFLPFIQRVTGVRRYKQDAKKVEPKERKIAYASHLDSAIFTYYSAMLAIRYEQYLAAEGLSHVPVAYRHIDAGNGRGCCNIHFAFRAFSYISHNKPCIAIAYDVKGFFDTMDHRLLLEAWQEVKGEPLSKDEKKVFKSITRYAYVDECEIYEALGIPKNAEDKGRNWRPLCSPEEFRRLIRRGGLIRTNHNNFGVPQGSPISAVLSNVYMIPFDRVLDRIAAEFDGFVQRYSDDIIVVVPIGCEKDVEIRIQNAINERKLDIQPEKTEQVVFSDALLGDRGTLNYLGFTYDGQRVLLRPKTLARFYRRARNYIRVALSKAARNKKHPAIYRRKLHQKFSHRGKRTFLRYVYRATHVACDPQWYPIQKQVARHQRVLNRAVEDLEIRRLERIRKRRLRRKLRFGGS